MQTACPLYFSAGDSLTWSKTTARSLLAALLLYAGTAAAQGVQSDAGPVNDGNDAKLLCLRRGDTSPVIDGVLDDDAWSQAVRIEDLHQFQPVDHGTPSEKTEFFVSYDDDYFYVGARLFDSNPEAISARQLVQGKTLIFDDAIEFLLDPFDTRRSGYWFQLNPNGIRRDGLYESPTVINRDWDGIWLGEAKIDEAGWTAEIAIPFKSLSFSPDNSKWGFTIARTISRKKEEIAWSSFDRGINPGSAGYLDCIDDIRQGRGLDTVPSVAVKQVKESASGVSHTEVEPSLNIYYKLTPSLTAALTLNTDFSATEVDDRQVNLTRFSLFFPEKRQFFNQDVDIFSFGGLEENGRPFFSRRIGLSDAGEPVDIIAGVKVTGRIGRWNIGVLDVLQDEFAGIDKSNIFVGRASANVLKESSVGLIVTSGNPIADLDNQLIGADFRYRNTSLVAGKTIQGAFWYQQSDTEGISADEEAYGWRVEYPNSEQWFGAVGHWVVEANFNPAVGFVNRPGIVGRKGEFGYTFTPNGRWLRNVGIESILEIIENTDGELETREIILKPLVVETQFGDTFEMRFKRLREVLDENFDIHPGVVIGIGDYEFDRVQLVFAAALERHFAFNLDLEIGEFFAGDRFTISGGADWRPGKHLYLQLGFEFNDVDLPQGAFITRLYRMRMDYAFNSKWSWLNVLQYDNVSDFAGLNSRLRYNPQAGHDVFLVVNRQFDIDPFSKSVSSSASEIVLKLNYTLRF